MPKTKTPAALFNLCDGAWSFLTQRMSQHLNSGSVFDGVERAAERQEVSQESPSAQNSSRSSISERLGELDAPREPRSYIINCIPWTRVLEALAFSMVLCFAVVRAPPLDGILAGLSFRKGQSHLCRHVWFY